MKLTTGKHSEPLPDCNEGVYEVPNDKSCNPLPFCETCKTMTKEKHARKDMKDTFYPYDGDEVQKYNPANDPGEDDEPRFMNDMHGHP